MATNPLRNTMTVAEAAKALNLPRRTVQRRIQDGTLPAHKIGDGRTSAYVIRTKDVEAFASGDAA